MNVQAKKGIDPTFGRRSRISILLVAVALSAFTNAVNAKPQEFDFKDPKGVNSVGFFVDSLVEPIFGGANGVSGKVNYDPEKPAATTGKIIIDANSLHTENKGMTDTLLGTDWLDAKKNPTIEFSFKKVSDAKKIDDTTQELTVVGDLLCKGITKEQTVKVRATYLVDGMSQRQGPKAPGDLLVLRADFVIKRADYQIKPDMPGKVVGEEIQLKAAIAGGAKKSG